MQRNNKGSSGADRSIPMRMAAMRVVLCALVAVMAASPAVAKGAELCCVSILVDAKSRVEPAGIVLLHIRLTNTGSEVLRFDRSFLPWASRLPIILAAAQERWPHEALHPNPVTVIKDPGPGIVTIASGQSVEGDIRLTDEFDRFAETLKKESVVVLWSYQLTTSDGRMSARMGGAIAIPRG
jgi:hypothetical protein